MSSLPPYHRRLASNVMLCGGEFIPRPLVEVDAQGVICSVGQYEDVDRLESTEFYAGIMTAGFVNAHSHIELSYLRGCIEPYGGFTHFARGIAQYRGCATPLDRQQAIQRADLEMRGEGIVAVGDILNGDSSMSCKSTSRIKYHNFGEVFGLRTTSSQQMEWVRGYPNSSITPHSTYSLNEALFREIVGDDKNQILSIHFLESEGERDLYHRRGEMWEWYSKMGFECDFLHYGSAARRIVESVPAHRSVMLVHNCFVTQRDIETIMSHFIAPVYWVLCPKSNQYISQVTPPVELLRGNGLNICIGTDSLASNTSLSILEEILSLGSVPLQDSLDWATRQGAAALGFDELGDIVVGKRPGINIISGVDYKTMTLTPKSQVKVII